MTDTFTLPPGIDELPVSWPFDLGQNFLTAAQSCGFTCACSYVSDGGVVEGSCEPCQLVAVVDTGWAPSQVKDLCLPIVTATVRLLLDQCYVVPGGESGPDPLAINTQAEVNLSNRWRIMAGLKQARAAGALGVSCGNVLPAAWTPLWQEGGCARWQTVWTVTM